MRSRFRTARTSSRLGAAVHVAPMTLHFGSSPDAATAIAPAPSSAPTFWESASDTEKVVIVGASLGAAALLWMALRRKRRRR